jgi:hypothetical protein
MDRRTFLRGAAASTGVCLAGCSEILGSDSAAGAGRQWLPSGQALPYESGGVARYNAVLTSPAELSNHRRDIGTNTWAQYRSTWVDSEYRFSTPDELDAVAVALTPAGVLFSAASGTFRPIRIADRLENDEFSSVNGDSEFTYYRSATGTQVYAFTSEAFIVVGLPAGLESTDDQDPGLVEVVDTVIDAELAVVDRYGDNNPALGALVDRGLSGESIRYQHHPERWQDRDSGDLDPAKGQFQDHLATAVTQEVSGSETSVTRVLAFRNEVVASDIAEAISTYVADGTRFESWRDLSWERDGQLIVIEGTRRSVDAWPLLSGQQTGQ